MVLLSCLHARFSIFSSNNPLATALKLKFTYSFHGRHVVFILQIKLSPQKLHILLRSITIVPDFNTVHFIDIMPIKRHVNDIFKSFTENYIILYK
jgi:hypothetical protein